MINILVLKNGKPLPGVLVSYEKQSMFGGGGSKCTDSSGYASFEAESGMASIRITGNGINYRGSCYLNEHVEFRF